MRRIYLDYDANTPIDPTVAAAMQPFLEEHYGNPSSGHWVCVEAKKAAREIARSKMAALLGCQTDEVVFTSGGSEANNPPRQRDRAPGDHRTPVPVSRTPGRGPRV